MSIVLGDEQGFSGAGLIYNAKWVKISETKFCYFGEAQHPTAWGGTTFAIRIVSRSGDVLTPGDLYVQLAIDLGAPSYAVPNYKAMEVFPIEDGVLGCVVGLVVDMPDPTSIVFIKLNYDNADTISLDSYFPLNPRLPSVDHLERAFKLTSSKAIYLYSSFDGLNTFYYFTYFNFNTMSIISTTAIDLFEMNSFNDICLLDTQLMVMIGSAGGTAYMWRIELNVILNTVTLYRNSYSPLTLSSISSCRLAPSGVPDGWTMIMNDSDELIILSGTAETLSITELDSVSTGIFYTNWQLYYQRLTYLGNKFLIGIGLTLVAPGYGFPIHTYTIDQGTGIISYNNDETYTYYDDYIGNPDYSKYDFLILTANIGAILGNNFQEFNARNGGLLAALDFGGVAEVKVLGVSIDNVLGDYVYSTFWRDGQLWLGVYSIIANTLVSFSLGNCTLNELDNRTYVAWPLAGQDDAQQCFVFGRMTIGGICHIAVYEAGVFSTIETGWGTDYCGSLVQKADGTLYSIRNSNAPPKLYVDGVLASTTNLVDGVNPHGLKYGNNRVYVTNNDGNAIMVSESQSPHSTWTNITANHGVSRGITAIEVIE